MLGIIIGVGAVIAMLSIGSGARHMIGESIEKFGTNSVFVWPGRRSSSSADRVRVKLSIADWKAVDRLPEVAYSSPIVVSYGEMTHGSATWSSTIRGCTNAYLLQKSWELDSGRYFNEQDIQASQNVVILGSEVRKELFGSVDPTGTKIRVKGKPFKVIGALKKLNSRDNSIFVPYSTLMKKIEKRDTISYMALAAHSADEVKGLKTIVVDLLNDRHQILDPKDGGFEGFSQAEAIETADKSTRTFSLLLGGIASISLVVGGIGIMNIMLVSVTERTREIGIRLAIGARGRDILSQFLAEAVVLSVVGGALGIVFGAGLANLIAHFAGWPVIISPSSVILSFGTSAAIGIFFGFYPALSASKLDPIEALRYE